MKLSHINITMPKGAEALARAFYSGHLGLPEIPKPEPLRVRGGVWFDAGGLDIHVSVEDPRISPDTYRHFGLECSDVDALRTKLKSVDIAIEDGRPAPWKRFFVRDPFGNRIEIHEAGGCGHNAKLLPQLAFERSTRRASGYPEVRPPPLPQPIERASDHSCFL